MAQSDHEQNLAILAQFPKSRGGSWLARAMDHGLCHCHCHCHCRRGHESASYAVDDRSHIKPISHLFKSTCPAIWLSAQDDGDMNVLTRTIVICLITALASGFTSGQVHAQPQVRIGDVTTLAGEHENGLVGLGLVTGLAGTGGSSESTKRLVVNFLQRLGLRADPLQRQLIRQLQEKTDNVSIVSVIAMLPPHAKRGQQIDVIVSTLDDAESLAGGVLISTPLTGPDDEVYAVASGPISINGGDFAGNAASVVKNHPTTGRIPGGGIIEEEVPSTIFERGVFNLILRDPSFETARRIAAAINNIMPESASVHDPAMVTVGIPIDYLDHPHQFVANCQEQLVIPDSPARVVINERTGTIVVGSNVRLSAVAITHGNLIVTTVENEEVVQPNAFSDGKTAKVDRSQVEVTEPPAVVNVFNDTTTVGDLAASLNALGVSPRDLSSIFQMLKESGSLHAALELK